MICPKCRFENRREAQFCSECGQKLGLLCPECGNAISQNSKFCDKCGCKLESSLEPFENVSDIESADFQTAVDIKPNDVVPIGGERKHVTVLFSDLIGYTAMSERLDPEEVKDITSKIFNKISTIIANYEGFIEKYAGDAVMALFGATETHEDDPVRAIKAAQEIHNQVHLLSPQYEERIEQPLVMHTGINTGLVVTGDVNFEKGTHGASGDAINIAARLSALGNAGEIIVGSDTFAQTEGYFDFEGPIKTSLKGKSSPIQVYKVLSQKEHPVKIHRLHGFKADLVGRNMEMNYLKDAAQKLKIGLGGVFSIHGTAGTGKSRLIQEFKASLNLGEIQWLEGQSFPYSQNISYFPLINLLSRSLQIDESDPSEEIRKKVENGLKDLMGENQDLIPYVASLFSLNYPEIEDVSPEYWKTQLQKAIKIILESISERAPTVVCLEDLHWADPSFLNLIRMLISEYRGPVLFLCIYRPIISLFTGHQISTMIIPYQEIRLQDLSGSESQGMVESLLKTNNVPLNLQKFLQDKVEGNPFYIEEVINSLIESDTLICNEGTWQLTRDIKESEISSTIHGLISGRLDRLEKESKRILQEASVIGRTFFYDILNRITELKNQVDYRLGALERLDLIRTRTFQPDLEYIFKHALTQEVVYNGLLKKERRVIHERIGSVMEQLFHNRIPEFYETLAFHFSRGLSLNKAISYLMNSAKKSLARYSVQESHQYYKQAFELLDSKVNKTNAEKELLIELLIDWAYVFYYRGYFKEMAEVFSSNKMIAESLEDKTKIGMFYSWFGWAFFCQHNVSDSYPYFEKALQIGEEIKNQQVIGYACTWLTWYYLMNGRLDLSIKYGERTQEISKVLKSDAYLYFKSLTGLGLAYSTSGDKKKGIEIGNALLDYGKEHSNIRSLTMGYAVLGGRTKCTMN